MRLMIAAALLIACPASAKTMQVPSITMVDAHVDTDKYDGAVVSLQKCTMKAATADSALCADGSLSVIIKTEAMDKETHRRALTSCQEWFVNKPECEMHDLVGTLSKDGGLIYIAPNVDKSSN